MVEPSARKWWPLLLPLAYLLHLAEEWWGGDGFVAWTLEALGRQVYPERFLLLNGVVWPLSVGLSVAAIRKPSLSWVPVAFAALLVLNAILHVLGSLATRSYSPGLVTSVLLYFPLGAYVLRDGSRRLPQRDFAAAVMGGVLAHAVVAAIAFG